MRHSLLFLLTVVAYAATFAQVPTQIQTYRDDAKGAYSAEHEGIMNGGRVRSYFYNTTGVHHWPGGYACEWPQGTGRSYIYGLGILIGAKVRLNDSTLITPIETHYWEKYDYDSTKGKTYVWGLEPVPGYADSTTSSPAMSDDKTTWPSTWTHWPGVDGWDTTHAKQETYFVTDDSQDKEFTRAPYGYFPIAADTARGGLGLRVETHELAWADTAAHDILFYVHDVINISDNDYDSAAVGLFFHAGVGVYQNAIPAQDVAYNKPLDLAYAWATGGLGNPDSWTTGYVGITFIQTPGATSADSTGLGMNNIALSAVTGAATDTVWVQNDGVIWARMTGGVADTLIENGDIVAVLSAGPFQMPKYSTTRFAYAVVLGTTKDEMFFNAAKAKAIAANGYVIPQTVVSVESPSPVPARTALDQNYPNPFNPTTTIWIAVGGVVAPSGVYPEQNRGVEGHASYYVRLVVYDVLGREVATLANGQYPAGRHSFTFDARNLSSGVYFYRLTAGSFTQTRKMMVAK